MQAPQLSWRNGMYEYGMRKWYGGWYGGMVCTNIGWGNALYKMVWRNGMYEYGMGDFFWMWDSGTVSHMSYSVKYQWLPPRGMIQMTGSGLVVISYMTTPASLMELYLWPLKSSTISKYILPRFLYIDFYISNAGDVGRVFPPLQTWFGMDNPRGSGFRGESLTLMDFSACSWCPHCPK